MLTDLGEAGRERRRLAVSLQTAWAAFYPGSDEARWVTGAMLPTPLDPRFRGGPWFPTLFQARRRPPDMGYQSYR